jgi:PST family polysaccharide transporter
MTTGVVSSPQRAERRDPTSVDSGHFRTDHLVADLKGRSVRGVAVTLSVQAVTFCLKLGSMMVLARLLVPADFGLVAMVTAVTGVFGRFNTLGLPSATVQRADINHRQVSTLLWINVGIAALLTSITAAVSPAIAWCYGEPRLTLIALALSGTFFLGGLSVQHQALLRRQMRFGALAFSDVASLAIGLTTGIVFAWWGAGYWALIAMSLAEDLAEATLAWLLCDWRPGLPSRAAGVGSMVAFGGNIAGASILNRASQSLDNVLIGMFWGAGPLGLYSRAYSLLKLPRYPIHAPISKIGLPSLSRLQDDPDRFRRYYQMGVMTIVALGMPIAAFAFADADLMVSVVLGEAWRDCVPIFQWLAPAAFIGTLNAATMWAFLPFGRSDRQMYLVLFRSALTLVAYAIGLPWGPIGVAAAFSISRIVLVVPELAYAFAGTPLRLLDLWRATWRPTAISLLAAAALPVIGGRLPASAAPPVTLLVHIALFAGVYVLAWVLVPGGRTIALEILQLSGHMVRRRSDRGAEARLTANSP